jgi:hypothetical protein
VANDERGYLISADRRYLGEAEARIVQARKAFAAALDSATTQEERRAVAQASDSFETWAVRLQEEFATFPKDRAAAVQASLGETRELRKTYESDLAEAQSMATASLAGENASIAGSASSSRDLLLGCLLAVLAAGLVIGWWIFRLVAIPVHRLLTLVSDLPLEASRPRGSAVDGVLEPAEVPMGYADVARAETERRQVAGALAGLLGGEKGRLLLSGNGLDAGCAVVVALPQDTVGEVMGRAGRHAGVVVVAIHLRDSADPRLVDGVALMRATPTVTLDGLVNPLGLAGKMVALWQLVSLEPTVRLVVQLADGRVYRMAPMVLPAP